MALIQCPECKKEISSKAKNCPNCGTPLAKSINWLGRVLAVVVIFWFITFFFSYNSTSISSKHATFNNAASQSKTINIPTERLKFGSLGDYADLQENKRQAQEHYLAQNPNLPEEIKKVVLNDEIYVGMSKDAVLGSWGSISSAYFMAESIIGRAEAVHSGFCFFMASRA